MKFRSKTIFLVIAYYITMLSIIGNALADPSGTKNAYCDPIRPKWVPIWNLGLLKDHYPAQKINQEFAKAKIRILGLSDQAMIFGTTPATRITPALMEQSFFQAIYEAGSAVPTELAAMNTTARLFQTLNEPEETMFAPPRAPAELIRKNHALIGALENTGKGVAHQRNARLKPRQAEGTGSISGRITDENGAPIFC